MTNKSALQKMLEAIVYIKEEERQPNPRNIRNSHGELQQQLKIGEAGRTHHVQHIKPAKPYY